MRDPRTDPILRAAIQIHRRVGPGLLESAYQRVLAHELRRTGHAVVEQASIDLIWDDTCIAPGAFKADLIVDELVLIEVKATRSHNPVFTRQLLTYLELTGLPVGLVLNFGQRRMVDGIQRFVRRP